MNREISVLASQLDRERIVQTLQSAFLNGSLNEGELGNRVSLALSARTSSDLEALVRDLAHEDLVIHQGGASELSSCSALAILSGIQKNGQLHIPKIFKSVAVLGGCTLDLRAATFASVVTLIKAIAVLGGIEVIVPRGVKVYVHQLPILGGVSCSVEGSHKLPLDAPSIHIQALAILGGIEIRTE